ncbi:MAG: xylulokinase [Alkalispirochaetaceae bacterium]
MSKSNGREYDPTEIIKSGKAVLGLELGSTRIKATIVGPDSRPLAAGSYGWENKFKDGVWTYDMDDVWTGLSSCFGDLISNVETEYGVTLSTFGAGGISGMMHGYLALDKDGKLLVPFRTWRNNITEEAATRLTELFNFPIPQRWSIAHLYQAILNGEAHLPRVARITTLASLVHSKLTGEHVIGTCEASGMFPVDPATQDYDATMVDAFDKKIADNGFPWKLRDLLPKIVSAGEAAGRLTDEGAKLLDPKGRISSGIPFAPPEGDAGTGMVATNSILPRTGNVSAGTSVFAMLVLEKSLSALHPEIDRVLTPDGKPVGMVHSNNCTSDLDAWVSLFRQALELHGVKVDQGELIGTLSKEALKGDRDAGGLLSYGYISGEHVTGFSEGRPLFVRKPDAPFTLQNFMRSHLFSSLCALRMGLNILTESEGVEVEQICGHGGFFKTEDIGQRVMAAATKSSVSVLETAGEGGPWGMALLAAYVVREDRAQSLPGFLEQIFADTPKSVVEPDPEDVRGFEKYYKRYVAALPVESTAVEKLQ